MRDSEALSRLVNQSGFPLQLAIDRLVTESAKGGGWNVLYREHGWKNPDGQSGFADLVLEDRHRTSVLVLECKRVLDADWIFLEPSGKANETLRTRSWVNNTPGNGREHSGYFDHRAKPASPESMYCVVVGQDPKVRPLLERIAAETCAATEAIALEEYPHLTARHYGFRMYVPVIVTTARLSVSSVDASQISLDKGEAASIVHREVPFLRFRKQLSSEFAVAPSDLDWSFSDLSSAREKMTFVVNSQQIEYFLKCWDILSDSLRPLMR